MEKDTLLALALFDDDTSRRLHNWKTVACREQGACDLLPPHITLGVFEAACERELSLAAAGFAAASGPTPVSFSHIGVFGTTVCFAAPCVNKTLLGFHAGFYAHVGALQSEVGHWYAPGRWVPHSTLFMGPWPGMQRALAAAVQNFVPFSGHITAIGVGHAMREVERFVLRGTSP